MNRRELVKALASRLSVTQAEAMWSVQVREETTTEALGSGGSLMLSGFETLSARKQAERVGRNPRNRVAYIVRVYKSVKFRPDKLSLKRLNASLSK